MSTKPTKLSLTTPDVLCLQVSGATITADFIIETNTCSISLKPTDRTTVIIGEDALAAMLWLACNTGISTKGILQKLLRSITQKGGFCATTNKWLYKIPPQLLTPEKDDQLPETETTELTATELDANPPAEIQPDDPQNSP